MKKRFVAIGTGFFFTLAVVCALGQQAKSIKVVPGSGPLAGQDVYANSFALIIRVNKYPELPKSMWLRFAVRDASDLAEVLMRQYGFPASNIALLLNERATREEILKNLRAMVDNARFERNDRVLVFFSGHGATANAKDGGEMGYWVPYDAEINPDDPNGYENFEASCVPMREVWRALEKCPSKHVLVIADACYSGLLAAPKGLPDVGGHPVVQAHADRRAMQIMTAGRRGEKAYERTDLGHGAFSYALLKELNRRSGKPGQVFTTTGLFGAIHDPVTEITKSRQTPTLGRHEDEEGEFLFITTEPQEASSPLQFVSLYNGRDLTGWRVHTGPPNSWKAQGETIAFVGGVNSWLGTEREYTDFVLRLDVRITPGTNCGVAVRFAPDGASAQDGMMIQILDEDAPQYKELPDNNRTGAIHAAVARRRNAARPAGQWNTLEITCQGPQVQVVLNGIEVLRASVDRDGKTPLKGKPLNERPRSGCIALNGGGNGYKEFRNLQIGEIAAGL